MIFRDCRYHIMILDFENMVLPGYFEKSVVHIPDSEHNSRFSTKDFENLLFQNCATLEIRTEEPTESGRMLTRFMRTLAQ